MTGITCIYTLLLKIVLLTHVLEVQSNDTETSETYVKLYEKGVEAYLENRFVDCVEHFENALATYGAYRKELQNCRLKCKNKAELSEPLYPVDIDNLLFYEKAIRQTLCIIECEKDNPGIFESYYVNPEMEELFEEQKPYEYLHICYFQTKDVLKAASSAFTYLVAHPEDKVMQSNLKHYSEMKDIDMKDIVNFEAKDYVYLYVHGADAYIKKDWKSVIDNMEESLVAYLQAEEECRSHCEGPFDHGWYPDFIPSISSYGRAVREWTTQQDHSIEILHKGDSQTFDNHINYLHLDIADHFTVSLKCKQKCRKMLGSLNGEIHDDLLPSHYHYLQYAYFKLGNLKAACRAVASYLLFYPDDDTMLDNMKYYSKQPKVQREFFQPRDEAIRYVQRHTYESKIMKFITNEFKIKENTMKKDQTSAVETDNTA